MKKSPWGLKSLPVEIILVNRQGGLSGQLPSVIDTWMAGLVLAPTGQPIASLSLEGHRFSGSKSCYPVPFLCRCA